jgi:hypothetical protein
MAEEPRHRALPYAILGPGAVAAGLIALFPEWIAVISTVAAVTIVGLALHLRGPRH